MRKLDNVVLGNLVQQRLLVLLENHASEHPGPWYKYWYPWNELRIEDFTVIDTLLGQAINEVLEAANQSSEDTTKPR